MWRWLGRSSNQKIVTLLGSAIAAVAIAAWTVFTYFDQGGGEASSSVEADHGVAAGGNIEGSTITIEGGSDPGSGTQ